MGLLGSFCYIDTITGFLSRLDIRKPTMRPVFLAGFFLLAFAAIQRRHYIRGALCGLLGLYISLYLKSCRHWLDGLGLRFVQRSAELRLERSPVLSGNYFVDRKSTRLNSSHVKISYAVFCLKKKINNIK